MHPQDHETLGPWAHEALWDDGPMGPRGPTGPQAHKTMGPQAQANARKNTEKHHFLHKRTQNRKTNMKDFHLLCHCPEALLSSRSASA